MIDYLKTWPTVEEIRQPLQAQPDRLIDSGQGRQNSPLRIPVAIVNVWVNSPGIELTWRVELELKFVGVNILKLPLSGSETLYGSQCYLAAILSTRSGTFGKTSLLTKKFRPRTTFVSESDVSESDAARAGTKVISSGKREVRQTTGGGIWNIG